MKAVIQRVNHSKLKVNKSLFSEIGLGLMILLGVTHDDEFEDLVWLAKKIAHLRIFDDENGVMNKSVIDINGEIQVVSQFTLFALTKKGNRPSYINAAKGDFAEKMYESFIKELQKYLEKIIKTGKFGSNMSIEFENMGPVTIIIDSKNKI
jgi:D-tyrosyl-tRNA(Tyr) deacylase